MNVKCCFDCAVASWGILFGADSKFATPDAKCHDSDEQGSRHHCVCVCLCVVSAVWSLTDFFFFLKIPKAIVLGFLIKFLQPQRHKMCLGCRILPGPTDNVEAFKFHYKSSKGGCIYFLGKQDR